jgi:hypothetical protein
VSKFLKKDTVISASKIFLKADEEWKTNKEKAKYKDLKCFAPYPMLQLCDTFTYVWVKGKGLPVPIEQNKIKISYNSTYKIFRGKDYPILTVERIFFEKSESRGFQCEILYFDGESLILGSKEDNFDIYSFYHYVNDKTPPGDDKLSQDVYFIIPIIEEYFKKKNVSWVIRVP